MFEKILATSRARNEQGATAVEYGLLVALIAAVVVVAVFAMGSLVRNTFTNTCSSIAEHGTTTSDNGCAGN
jgi:pilus assembly protein Flp/PilA